MSARSQLALCLAVLFLSLNLYFIKDFHKTFGPGAAFWDGFGPGAAVPATASLDPFGPTAPRTTCPARRRNRSPLHVDATRRGGFPVTQFTHFLRTDLIDRFNATHRDAPCDHGTLRIRQASPTADVVVESLSPGSTEFKRVLRDRVFAAGCRRRLPLPPPDGGGKGAATTTAAAVFGFVGGDFADPEHHRFQCFSKGSTAGGVFSLYNFQVRVRSLPLESVTATEPNHSFALFSLHSCHFQHVRAMEKLIVRNRQYVEDDNQYASHFVPWEDRGTVPIWRGALRGGEFGRPRSMQLRGVSHQRGTCHNGNS